MPPVLFHLVRSEQKNRVWMSFTTELAQFDNAHLQVIDQEELEF